MRTLAVIFLALVLLSIAALWGTWKLIRSSDAKFQSAALVEERRDAQAELDRKRAESEAAITVAKVRQNEVLRTIRKTTTCLSNVITGCDVAAGELTALRANDTGRIIARFQDLVVQAARLYKMQTEEVASKEELIKRIEDARRFEFQLMDQAGTPYIPSEEFLESVDSALSFAFAQKGIVDSLTLYIATLKRETRVKVLPNDGYYALTLDDALAQRENAEALARLQPPVTLADVARSMPLPYVPPPMKPQFNYYISQHRVNRFENNYPKPQNTSESTR